MTSSTQQVISLVRLSIKRITRERLLVVFPVIIAVILGVACRFSKAGLPAGVMLVGVVVGVTTMRQLWVDRATHFYDCLQSIGAGARTQAIAAFVLWVIETVCLGALVFALARL